MSTSSRQPAPAPHAAKTRDVERYLQTLFGREPSGALIEVRYRHRDGMLRDFFACTDTHAAARRILHLGLRSDVYVGVAPRRRRGGGKDAIDRLWTLWADLDDPTAHHQLQRLPVAPAIVIASGSSGHRHAYWPLQHPISVSAAEAANRRLAAALGADSGAVTNAATILRPPGTYSFKTAPPVPVVLEHFTSALTTAQAATRGIATDPCAASLVPVRRAPAPRDAADPLRALDPAHYVSVLTGQTVGRSRKISCPFHEDRTPSLHVYEDPEDGWFCFGCKRHGHTVYDLASALWQLDTRGPSFIELRARLYELFLPGHSPPAPPRARRGR